MINKKTGLTLLLAVLSCSTALASCKMGLNNVVGAVQEHNYANVEQLRLSVEEKGQKKGTREDNSGFFAKIFRFLPYN